MTKPGRKRKSKKNRKTSIPAAAFRTLEENRRILEQTRATRPTRAEKRAQREREREERRERLKLPYGFHPEAPLETYSAEEMQTYLEEMGIDPLSHLIDYLPPDFLASIPPDAETISTQVEQEIFHDWRFTDRDFFRPYAAAGKIAFDSGMYTITLPLPLHEHQPVPTDIVWAIEKSPGFDALALANGATIDVQVTREAVARADKNPFQILYYLRDHHWRIVQHHAYTCTISQATLRLHAIRKPFHRGELIWHVCNHNNTLIETLHDEEMLELQELVANF